VKWHIAPARILFSAAPHELAGCQSSRGVSFQLAKWATEAKQQIEQQVGTDLDDAVKVNYNKFGKALK
jgi:hypothetical protein